MNSYLESMQRLREDFLAAQYVVDPLLEAIGEKGQSDLTRNHTMATSRALEGRDDGLATLIRLFVLQQNQPAEAVRRTLDVDALAAMGILAEESGQIRATVDIRPFGDETDQSSGWVVSDHAASLDTQDLAPRPDHVLGVSPASISLSQITDRRNVGSALDLGTGCGIQALHLAWHADRVTATDMNPRALTLAGLTFALNQVDVSTRLGSLYEPVEDDRFDLIATNPPFVISPDSGPRLVYRETEYRSDDLMRAVVSGAGPRLNPGGSLHVVGNWAHVKGEDWKQRLTGWIPDGCDAFIVQREILDVYEYIEIWLADAGLRGHKDYLPRYRQWLEYFDCLGVEGVGMGWITMVKSGSSSPRVVCEHWPYPVEQPVAHDLMAHLTAMDYQSWSDSQILDRRWLLAPGTVQETTGVPGDPDPAHIVLRRIDGLKRAIDVDAGLGGVLGACDGELTLGMILPAVATLIEADHQSFVREVMPQIRQLISQTWLTPVRETD